MGWKRLRRLLVVSVIAGLAATAASGATGAAASSSTNAAKRFIAELNAAFKAKKTAFLFDHLDPAVIDRYGADQCRQQVMTLVSQRTHIAPHRYGAPADYTYTSDGLSTTVHDVIPVTATLTLSGKSRPTTVHVTRTTWFTDCGNLVGSAAALAAAEADAGHYSGTWHNDTYNTSGSLVLDLTVDPSKDVLHVTVTLGGNVFGDSAPPPETLDIPINDAGAAAPASVDSAFLGPITLVVQPDQSLVVDARAVPGGVIASAHAVLARTATGIHGTYQLTFAGSGNTASGTVDATKS